jgi:hypothetical protein
VSLLRAVRDDEVAQKAIDVRDIIEVPEGQLAPWGYIEYLPDRFAPGPTLTNTPPIPQPR